MSAVPELPSVRARYSILALVTGAQLGASVVQQGLGTLAPAITQALGLSSAQFGWLVGAMLFGSAIATALAGVAVDAYGERRMILISGIVIGFSLFLCSVTHTYWLLLGCLAITGLGYAAATPAGGRAILLWFTHDRGLAMGIRQMGVPLGGFVGALLLPSLANAYGYGFALAAGGVLALATAGVAAQWYRVPEHHAALVPKRVRELLVSMVGIARDPRLMFVMVTGMVLIVGQSSMVAFFPLHLVRVGGVHVAVAGAAIAVAQIGASLGRLGWGALSDRIFHNDRVAPMMVACLLVSGSALTVAFVPAHAALIIFPLALVFGFAAAGWNGVHSAAQVEIGGPERAGSALGVALTGLFAAGVVAPPIFGKIVDVAGFQTAWLALAAFSLVGLIPAVFARRAIAAVRV
ncbi:MAG: MFS transporter [Candidatus Eremiobacteraeota bacterium]|nr:MFS transporter [Candidatus Eremiobacteraeota bacterium]